jgi:2-polyprenyl-3-methyl-5-hydroxy-6-metoxy-1,4-benzoquinol methylase
MGEIPLLLSQRGFSACGLDESATAIGYLKNRYPQVDWTCGEVLERIPTLGRFDVITMYHVLEHIPHPVEVMRTLREILQPGGCLVVEVPNMAGLRARLMGRRWNYFLEHHVNYFRDTHLRMLAKTIGCTTLEVAGYYDFTFPIGSGWKVAAKRVLRAVGFQDVVSIVMQRTD